MSVSAGSAVGLLDSGCAQLVHDLLRTERNMSVGLHPEGLCPAPSQQCSAYPPGFQLLLEQNDLHGGVLKEILDRYLPEWEIPDTLISQLWGELLSGAQPELSRAIWMCSSYTQRAVPDRLVPDLQVPSHPPARSQLSSFAWLARAGSDMLKTRLGGPTAATLDWFDPIRHLPAAAGILACLGPHSPDPLRCWSIGAFLFLADLGVARIGLDAAGFAVLGAYGFLVHPCQPKDAELHAAFLARWCPAGATNTSRTYTPLHSLSHSFSFERSFSM